MWQCLRANGVGNTSTPRVGGGGITDALGLASYDGYECDSCGVLLCSDCYNKRTVELAGAAPDSCPQCDGRLAER